MSKKCVYFLLIYILHGASFAADPQNYSFIQSIKDTTESWLATETETVIRCFDCEDYLKKACLFIQQDRDTFCTDVENKLSESKQVVFTFDPYFCFGKHEKQFVKPERDKPNGNRIPLCTSCIEKLLTEDFEDAYQKYPVLLTQLPNKDGGNSGSMTSTSFGGQRFGSVYSGMTPLWQDIFKTVETLAWSGKLINFIELGSGFNIKPLALWVAGAGKINCWVNDINQNNSKDFTKQYLLLDPRVFKAEQKSFITLDIHDFLSGDLSNGQKFDVVVITNVFHYFTADYVKNAMAQLSAMTNKDSIVYIQAFSGTDKSGTVNFLLQSLVQVKDDEPIYLANGQQQIKKFFEPWATQSTDDENYKKADAASNLLPNIVEKSAKPFTFFPLASLKKLGKDHGFEVIGEGLFDINEGLGQKTPLFSWVKLKKL